MLNQIIRGEFAYTIIEIQQAVYPENIADELKKVSGVIRVNIY